MRGYVAPDILLRMLINKRSRKKSMELLAKAEAGEIELVTSDFALKEALLSIEDTDEFDIMVLRRIFATMSFESFDKMFDEKVKMPSFTDARKTRLRSVATAEEGA
jgi:hypothetical protein